MAQHTFKLYLSLYFAVSVQIDLSDVNGSVRCLIDNQKLNASEFLKERELFILVKVESKE